MDAGRLDHLVRTVAAVPSRRAMLGLAVAGALTGLGRGDTAAKKKNKKKQCPACPAPQTCPTLDTCPTQTCCLCDGATAGCRIAPGTVDCAAVCAPGGVVQVGEGPGVDHTCACNLAGNQVYTFVRCPLQ